MSKNIDERVVEMRFDNKHFEDNVQETMSTIDKLKKKLNFTGATKGLENIGDSAKKVNMTPLTNAAETVRLKFSALEVMAVTALQNITNTALNAGKRIVSALTIEPVKTGFSEYELKMNSIQTIMAGTGADLETVNKYLNELNEYSDKTIYSFSDMTQNIGKFTNAGVKLEDAVLAIKGVSNEAAVSGANANEAARAMYNFAQALSAGYVKLIDWKSIENANMATVEFKNELIKTGLALGTVTDAGDGLYKTLSGNTFNATTRFNEVLQDQWMTSDVLIETLKKYADETTDIGKKSTEAATKVKTFTMLLDTLKEAAQSGWAQTWELIVGDFEEARTLFTKISDVVGGIIGKSADARNNLLKGALSSKWSQLEEQITKAGIPFDDFQKKLIETAKSHGVAIDLMIEKEGSFEKTLKHGWLTSGMISETLRAYTTEFGATNAELAAITQGLTQFGDVVDQVIVGNFGNGAERIKLLTDAGYDYATIQDLVNKVLNGTVDELEKLSAEQLKNLGFTEEQISAIQLLSEEAEKSGTSINKLISDLDKPSGRELLIDTFRNALKGLGQIIASVGKAWSEIFPPMAADSLYDAIEGIHNLSKGFILSKDTTNKLQRAFKGLFAVLDVVRAITTGALKIGFKILAKVLGMVDEPILDVAAHVGDLLTKFREWFFTNTLITDGINVLVDFLANTIKEIIEWFKAFRELPETQEKLKNFKEYFSKALYKFRDLLVKCGKAIWNFGKKLVSGAKKIKAWFDEWRALPNTQAKLDKFEEVFTSMFNALSKLIQNGISKLKSIGKKFIEAAKKIKIWFDEFKSIPEVQKALNDFKKGTENVLSAIKKALNACKKPFVDFLEQIKSLDSITFEDILAALKELGTKIAQNFSKVGDSFKAIPEALNTLANECKIKLGETWKGFDEFLIKIQYFAKSIKDRIGNIDLGGIILAALGIGTLTVGSKIGDALEALTAPLVGLGELLEELAKGTKTVKGLLRSVKFTILAGGFAALAAGILILAGAVTVLTLLDQSKLWSAVGAVSVLGIVLIAVAATMAWINKGISNIVANTTAVLALAGSVLILAVAMGVIASIKTGPLIGAFAVLTLIIAELATVAVILSKKTPKLFTSSISLVAFAAAIVILTKALKTIADIDGSKLFGAIVTLTIVIAELSAVAIICSNVRSQGIFTALAAVVALKILVNMLDDLAAIKFETILRSLGALLVIAPMLRLVMSAVSKAGEHAAKAGLGILAISVGLIFMVTTLKMLAKMDPLSLISPLMAISVLMLMISGVIKSTGKAGAEAAKAGAMLLMMAGAMAILAVVVAVLSRIDPEGLFRAVLAITVLEACFAGLIFITRYAKAFKGVKAMLITFTVLIGILAAALVALSLIDESNVLAASGALSATLIAMTILVKVLGKIETISTKSLVGVLLVGAIAAGLGAIIYCLSDQDPESVISSATSLSEVLLALAAACKILSTIKTISVGGLASIAILTLIVAALGGILYLLRDLDPESTLVTALSLSTLLLALSGVCAILTAVGAAAQPALVGIGVLAALIAAMSVLMGAIGALVTEFPQINDWLDNAMSVFEKIGYGLGKLIGSIVGGLSAGILSGLPEIADSLTKFMTKMEEFFASVGKIDSNTVNRAKTIAELVGELAEATLTNNIGSIFGGNVTDFVGQLTALGEGMLAFSNTISGEDGNPGIDQASIEAAKAAGSVLVELVNMIPNLGGVVGFFSGSLDKMKLFSEQITLVAQAIVDFSSIVTGEDGGSKINQKSIESAKTAGSVMVELANMIPNLGGVVGFFSGSLDKMKLFSEQITLVAQAIVDFSSIVTGEDGGSKINKESVEAAKAAGSVMVELANMVPNLGGVVGFFSGNLFKIEDFARQMPILATGITDFSSIVTGEDGGSKINQKSIDAAKCAGETMSELAKTVPNNSGLVNFFNGNSAKIEDFARQMPILASGIVAFSQIVTGEKGGSKVDVDSIEAAKSAGLLMSELGAHISQNKTGGLFSFLIGGNMATFAAQLPILASGIVAFSQTVTGEKGGSKVDVDSVEAAKKAGEMMTALSKYITNTTANWLEDIFSGQTSKFENFKKQMPLLGDAIVAFSKSIAGKINSSAVTSAETVSKVISVLFTNMSAADINQMSKFNSSITNLGESIFDFYEDVISINITSLSNNMRALNDMVEDIVWWIKSVDTNRLTTFGTTIERVGGKITEFYRDLAGINLNKFTAALDVVNDLIRLTMDMTKVDTNGMNAFGASLTSLGATGVDRFVKGFSDGSVKIKSAANTMLTTFCTELKAKTNMVVKAFEDLLDSTINIAIKNKQPTFQLAGNTLVTWFATGITAKASTAITAASGVAESVITAFRNKYSSSESAGKYLVDGFAAGIRSKVASVTNTARNLARSAADAIEDELGIRSPSRVLYKDGEFSGMGFVNALADYADKSYDAGANLADSARMGLRKAIARVVDTIDSDVDTDPVIRPVLDLTNVESGARRLNTMFARTQVMSIDIGNRHTSEEDQNGDAVGGRRGNVYNYTQNNYSPKALSRLDIYRQTKNQFSAMERMVEDHG